LKEVLFRINASEVPPYNSPARSTGIENEIPQGNADMAPLSEPTLSFVW